MPSLEYTCFLVGYLASLLLILAGSLYGDGRKALVVRVLGYLGLWVSILLSYIYRYIDDLSLVFSSIAIYIAIPVSIYTPKYIELGRYSRSLQLAIDLFSSMLITAFASPNILLLAVPWTIAELVGFYLVSVGEEHVVEGSTRAARRFLLVSATTFELTLFTMIYISVFMLVSAVATGADVFEVLLKPFWVLGEASVPVYMVPLLLVGFIAKSALVPLHFWLPDAHSVAPAPASALLSGVMTGMGIYGILRVMMIADIGSYTIAYALMVLGLLSILYGGLQAYVQRDGKKLLAYSTIAGNGFSMSILGFYLVHGGSDIITALLLAVAAHAGYKATLFLDIGLAEQATGLRFVHRLRGLSRILPYSSLAGLLALFSIMGVPPTTGFLSKLLAILISINAFPSPLSLLLIACVVATIVVSILMGLRYVRIYYGEPIILYSEPRVRGLRSAELSVLLLSLSSLLFTLIVFLHTKPLIYVLLIGVSTPPLLVLLYALYIMARRAT